MLQAVRLVGRPFALHRKGMRRVPGNVAQSGRVYGGLWRRVPGNVARLRAGQGAPRSIVGGYERAFLFSCGYFCAESHCGGRGGSQGKRHRTQQTQRFQSDPPRAAPELVPSVYTADPRGPRAAREALAAFLNTAKAVDASSPQSTSPAASEGGNERHAAFNNANTAIEGVDPDACTC